MWITGALVTTILGLSGFTIKFILRSKDSEIKSLKDDISSTQTELNKIKINYLDRFEKVNSNISSTKEEILEAVHGLALSVMQVKTKLEDLDATIK